MMPPKRHEDESCRDSAEDDARPPEANPDLVPRLSPHSPGLSKEDVREAVREAVGLHNFQHWFSRRTSFQVIGNQLEVVVPNPFTLNWIQQQFRSELTRAAQTLLGSTAQVAYSVQAAEPAGSESAASTPHPKDQQTALTAAASESSAPPAVSGSRPNPAAANPLANGEGRPGGGRRTYRSFDSLVTGECNDMVVLAARHVARDPGARYNPLYVYGGSGTGKSHVLEAIYRDIRTQHPQLQVNHLTGESFTNMFTAALAAKTLPSFRQRFRHVDVLLVDNVEFLDNNKKATQEEFLHTIVQITESGGQICVTGDRHPRLLTRHREDLTSRFLSGLVCRLDNPDEMTCQSIIRRLADRSSARIADDALEFVARRCRRSIRELQGAVNALEGHFVLHGKRITLNKARQILGELTHESDILVRISDVERAVCEAFDISVKDLRSRSRRKAIAVPRAVAMFLARRRTRSAYREIGSYFGGRDHSTVVAAEKRVAGWLADGAPVALPNTLHSRTMNELIDTLNTRLLAAAS